MNQQQKSPPIKEFKAGNTKAAIWRNEVQQGGKTVVQHSIKFQKGYKDPTSGEWVNMEINLFPSEVPDARLVLDHAFEYCRLSEKDDAPE